MNLPMLYEIAAHHRSQALGVRATAQTAPNGVSSAGFHAMADVHETWARELRDLADAFSTFGRMTAPTDPSLAEPVAP